VGLTSSQTAPSRALSVTLGCTSFREVQQQWRRRTVEDTVDEIADDCPDHRWRGCAGR
jgi:hypothetical protein